MKCHRSLFTLMLLAFAATSTLAAKAWKGNWDKLVENTDDSQDNEPGVHSPIKAGGGGSPGVALNVHGGARTPGITGTTDWSEVSVEFVAKGELTNFNSIIILVTK